MNTSTGKLKFSIAITLAAALLASATLPAAAAGRVLSDKQRASNVYPIYLSDTVGCVGDRGYGMIVEGACGD
jgi:hypothetical protein